MAEIEDFGGKLRRRRHRRLLAAHFLEFDYLAPIFGRPRLSHETYLLMAEAATLIDLCEIQYRRMRSAVQRAMSRESTKRARMTRIGAILIARGEVGIFIGLARGPSPQRRKQEAGHPADDTRSTLGRGSIDSTDETSLRARHRPGPTQTKKGRSAQVSNPVFHKAFGIIENGIVTFGADKVTFDDMPRWLDWMRQAHTSHQPRQQKPFVC